MHRDTFQRLRRSGPPSDPNSEDELMIYATAAGRTGQVDHLGNAHLFAFTDEGVTTDDVVFQSGFSPTNSIPNGGLTVTLLQFDTTPEIDEGGWYNSSNPTHITVPEDGWYTMTTFVRFAATAGGGRRTADITHSTRGVISADDLSNYEGGSCDITVPRVLFLNAGETLAVGAYQTSGGALDCWMMNFAIVKLNTAGGGGSGAVGGLDWGVNTDADSLGLTLITDYHIVGQVNDAGTANVISLTGRHEPNSSTDYAGIISRGDRAGVEAHALLYAGHFSDAHVRSGIIYTGGLQTPYVEIVAGGDAIDGDVFIHGTKDVRVVGGEYIELRLESAAPGGTDTGVIVRDSDDNKILRLENNGQLHLKSGMTIVYDL